MSAYGMLENYNVSNRIHCYKWFLIRNMQHEFLDVFSDLQFFNVFKHV